MTKLTANEVGACDLGRRIRFFTTDGALIEDELVVLHAEQGEPGEMKNVLFGVKHVRPGSRDIHFGQQEYGYLFTVLGSSRVELTDKS